MDKLRLQAITEDLKAAFKINVTAVLAADELEDLQDLGLPGFVDLKAVLDDLKACRPRVQFLGAGVCLVLLGFFGGGGILAGPFQSSEVLTSRRDQVGPGSPGRIPVGQGSRGAANIKGLPGELPKISCRMLLHVVCALNAAVNGTLFEAEEYLKSPGLESLSSSEASSLEGTKETGLEGGRSFGPVQARSIIEHYDNDLYFDEIGRTARLREAVIKGNELLLREALHELSSAKRASYGDNPLRSAKNLALIDLTEACRAAIEGGAGSAECFLIADGFMLSVEKERDTGRIALLVRECCQRLCAAVRLCHESPGSLGDKLILDIENYVIEHKGEVRARGFGLIPAL